VSSDKFDDAVQLIKSGNKPAAVPMLKEIVQANPGDEDAWLWLHSCVEQVEEKKYCLQKALEINPDNQPARNALKKLTDLTPQPVQQAAAQTETLPQPAPLSGSEPAPRGSKSPWFFALGAIILFMLLCAGSVFYLAQTGQLVPLAASVPIIPSATVTPSLTPEPSATATVTPSPPPTLTFTATLRPSFTPIPVSATSTPLPTIAPFTPGNPTATPLGSEITDPNFNRGVVEYSAKHFEKVIDLMSAVITVSPQLAPPYQYRGMAYWYLGQCASGLVDEDKALSINPNYAQAWADRGVINNCLKHDNQALADYQKALSLDPSLAIVHHNLGIYYYDHVNYVRSLEEYSLSVAIDPSRSVSWVGKSKTLAKLGQYDECILSANQALEVNREEWPAYSARATCELAQGSFTEALQDYQTYAARNPSDPTGLYNVGAAYGQRGDFYYEEKQYNKAIADYKMAVSLISEDAHSYCQLSYSYFEVKQYQDALEAAKASIAINPECRGRKLYEVQARSAYALGDYKAGIEYMNQALAQGLYPLGYYYRGILYQAAERKAEAIQDLKQFLATGYSGEEVADARARLAILEP
jgi:tetratricopeptide (TPR) repeat protein